MSYSETEQRRAAHWKSTTPTLPDDARRPAAYVTSRGSSDGAESAWCLPPEYAAYSLLPEVRAEALPLFAELGIPWHAGVDAGPSNHLLSSQVQCVNALGQMVHDPERLKRAFGTILAIDEAVEIEPGRFLTFEYIGPKDYFNESPSRERVRGSRCTSVDAAFTYRGTDGVDELVLLEWKYTESYRRRRPNEKKDAIRASRYTDAVSDPSGPIRSNVLPFDLLLDEPPYQLVRQQILARALEQDPDVPASRVRVLHVSPIANREYQYSIHRAEHRAVGGSVAAICSKLLRHPDRFIAIDSSVFDDPDVTSDEYCARYADEVIRSEADLNRALKLDDAFDLEDLLYAEYSYDNDVEIEPDGIVLRIGTDGYGLLYPFTVGELRELATEVSAIEARMGY